MSNVPAGMLANIVLTESAEYRDYEKGFPPLLKRDGDEFVTNDDARHGAARMSAAS
jgi:hypothetical protein